MRQFPGSRQICRCAERTAERLVDSVGPLPSIESYRQIGGNPPAAPRLESHSKRLLNRVFSFEKGHFPAEKGLRVAGHVYRSVNEWNCQDADS
jgi:hypothetical protein